MLEWVKKRKGLVEFNVEFAGLYVFDVRPRHVTVFALARGSYPI